MSSTRPRPRRSDFLNGGVPLMLLVASACAGQSQALPASGLPSPVPPAQLATVVATARASPVGQASAPRGPQIPLNNFNFTPVTISVPAGTTVTWTNHDDTPHTVTASDRSFGSTAIDTDAQFTETFGTPGTYSYFCSIHPFMTAKVIVQ